MRILLALTSIVAIVGATGCPDIKEDPGEGSDLSAGSVVEFDPAKSIVPFPNNLLLDKTGHVSIPKACNEGATATALREGVLNKLDGFGTYEVGLQATFTSTPDMATLTSSTVVLYKRADSGTAVDTTGAQPIPTQLVLGKFPRLGADCATVSMIDTVTIVPLVPLDQHSTYTVALLSGIKDASGADFSPSFTWSLVRQANDPVTLDADGNIVSEQTPLDPSQPVDALNIKGIDLLWKAHAAALTFLGKVGHDDRSKILLAWEFNTQTTTDPLDKNVPTSPAATVASTPFAGLGDALPTLCHGQACTPQQFLEGTPIGPLCNDHPANGGYIPCDKVGAVLGGILISADYQQDVTNPFDAAHPIPGTWADPVHPTAVHEQNQIVVFAMIPTGEVPAGGWPTVIFGHGLGSSKGSLIAIGPQLAAQGYASIAIDFVAHGDRAVRVSDTTAVGCAGTGSDAPDPTERPQCFAPFLSADLGTTRDNIRQTVVDLHRLRAALVACGAATTPAQCGLLKVDATRIEYIGISLGGIIGTTFTSTAGLKAATLNVPGVGLVDILENTANLTIRCSLVDSLIDAGIVTGDKSSGATQSTPPTAGLCLTDAWKTQPGYLTFSGAARWILDPADGANFTRKLAAQKFLIQEVVDDQVVPNIATDREGVLVGLTPGIADLYAPTGPQTPSGALLASLTTNHWVRYPAVPANGQFPGNLFQHASLLAPAGSPVGAAGIFGTIRLQIDAIGFLLANRG